MIECKFASLEDLDVIAEQESELVTATPSSVQPARPPKTNNWGMDGLLAYLNGDGKILLVTDDSKWMGHLLYREVGDMLVGDRINCVKKRKDVIISLAESYRNQVVHPLFTRCGLNIPNQELFISVFEDAGYNIEWPDDVDKLKPKTKRWSSIKMNIQKLPRAIYNDWGQPRPDFSRFCDDTKPGNSTPDS